MKKKILEKKLGGAFFLDSEVIKAFFKYFFKKNKGKRSFFVVSAMADVTRLLKKIVLLKTEENLSLEYNDEDISIELGRIDEKHRNLINNLFLKEDAELVYEKFQKYIFEIEDSINSYKKTDDEDIFYGHILKFGELMSSLILSEYIKTLNIKNILFDAREYVVTTDKIKEAEILGIKKEFLKLFNSDDLVFITQGFIGRYYKYVGNVPIGIDTVVGFDGSDYSAAFFANYFFENNYEVDLYFYKDQDGVYNKDPKNEDAVFLSEIDREELILIREKTGSSIIRVDSVKILNDGIKYFTIRSFENTECEGTKILLQKITK